MEKVGSKPYVYPQNDRHIFGQKRFRIKSLHQHLMKYVQGNSQVPPPNPQKVYKKLVALINNGGARGKKTPVPFSIFSGNSISLEQIKCLCVLVKSLLKDPKIKKGRVQLNSMKNSLNQYFARRRSMRRVTKPAFPLVMKTMVLHDLQNTGVRKKAFDGQSIKALIGVEQNCETIVSACGQWINGCLKNEEVVDFVPGRSSPKRGLEADGLSNTGKIFGQGKRRDRLSSI